MGERQIAMYIHPHRSDALASAQTITDRLLAQGVDVFLLGEAPRDLKGATSVVTLNEVPNPELVVVLGGDGTILKAAFEAQNRSTPVLGINLGHVGFLAEAERADVATVADAIVAHQYTVEERLALSVEVIDEDGNITGNGWGLNEIAVEKSGSPMVDLLVEVDGLPVSRWGCDGLLIASPTGSTAYAFSAGGPIIWPEVQAMTVLPIAAHALFARPLVVSPDSLVTATLQTGSAVVVADGARQTPMSLRSRIEVRRSSEPVRLARFIQAPFTNRLVAKFRLPIDGWRGSDEQ
jgi:NAD+ kinase